MARSPSRAHHRPEPFRSGANGSGRPTRPNRLITVALLCLLGSIATGPRPASALASSWQENPQSKVRLITPYRTAPESGPVWLGLQLALSPGWHVYWKNSGDAGFPPEIDFTATPALREATLRYPAPNRYELPGDLVAFGYDTEVVYPVEARMAAPAADAVEISLDLGYLVCEVDCVPYQYTLTVTQPVAAEAVPDPETAPLLDRWRARLARPVDEVADVTTGAIVDASDLAAPVLLVTVGTADGATPPPDTTPQIFFESHALFELGKPTLERTPDRLLFRVPLQARRHLDAAPPASDFAWTVTGLGGSDRGGPGSIEARRTVAVHDGSAPAAPPSTAGPHPMGAPSAQGTQGAQGPPGSPLAAVARGFAGGLLLAATPGALALLLAFVGGFRRAAAAGGRPLGLGLAACAGALGTALALTALATLAVAGRTQAPSAAGALSGPWRAHLAEPTVVTALTLLTLAVTLWFWGLLGDASGRLTPRAHGPHGRLGAGPAALAGACATLLALPWPVPPAPAAIARASASGGGGALLLLTTAAAVGLGLGLPWIVAARLAGRRPVPETAGDGPHRAVSAGEVAGKAAGTARARELLGFLAAAPILWLVYLLAASVRNEYLAFIELSLLAVALVAWLRQRSRRKPVRAVSTLAILALAATTLWLADHGRLRARLGAPETPLRRAGEQLPSATPAARTPGVG